MAEPVLMSPWIPVIAAMGGSLVMGIVNCYINHTNKKSEEKKHLATLSVNAAIENWKRVHEDRKGEDVTPIDIYMVHMTKLIQEILNDNVSEKNVADKLKKIDNIVDAMKKYAAEV